MLTYRLPRVMVIEDDAMQRTLVTHRLKAAGRSELFAQELHRQLSAAKELACATRDIGHAVSVDDVVERVVHGTCALVDGAFAVLWNVEDDGTLRSLGLAGPAGVSQAEVRLPRGQGLASLALERKRAVWVDDAFTAPALEDCPQTRALMRAARCRALVSVPLVLHGGGVGAISVGAADGRTFSASDGTLLERFADQAVLALANARLYEDGELRRREAESLVEMGRALSAELDPAQVAKRATTLIAELLGARSSAIYLRHDDGRLALMVASAEGDDVYWAPTLEAGHGISGLAAEQNRVVATTDVLTLPDIRFSEAMRARVATSPARAVLAVPLRARDGLTGVLTVDDRTGRVFDDQAARLAQAFAAQAAVALENARLHDAALVRSEERAALLRASHMVMAGLDLDTTLARVLAEASGIARTPHVKIFRLDAAAGVLRVVAGSGVPLPADFVPSLNGSYVGRVAATSAPFFVGDPQGDQENLLLDRDRAEGVMSFLGLPIRVGNEVLGVLTFATTEPRHYEPAEIEFLGSFADQAAIAIRNAELFQREQASRAAAEASREALRRSEIRYRAITDRSIQGIVIHRNDRILFANEAGARMVGYERPEELIGASVMGFVAPEERDQLATYARTRQDGAPIACRYELRVIRRDGEPIWIECLVSDIEWDGAPAILATLVEVTERKRSEAALHATEEEVRQLQKLEAIGRLAGGVAHDFNNLLTVILGRAELLARFSATDSDARRGVELIRTTARRASNLTKQLLAFSRKQILEPRVVDLNDVVEGMMSMLRRLIGEDVQVTTRAAEGLGRTLVDPVQVEQVLMNLAVNARDAMPSGGWLTIETANVELDETAARQHVDAHPGHYVGLRVSDTGCGMDAATQARIFEPFFTTKGYGTGLGLSTVFGVVKQSGGHIRVYSEPGRGTTFTVYFPCVDAPVAAPDGDGALTPILGGAETVMVVEDEDGIRELLVEILTTGGYTVLAAASGREALEIAARHTGRIDLLFTDIVMPGMSGRTLAERFTARHPEARVLYASGYTGDVILHHGVGDAGPNLVTKPFTVTAITRRIRDVLDAPHSPRPGPDWPATGRFTA